VGVDPIASQFPHVSVFNYAENEPIKHIDLWGLQKTILDAKALHHKTFGDAYAINRQTSGGREFRKTLASQSKIDVVYAILSQGYSGVTSGPFKSYEEFVQARSKSYGLYYATDETFQEYEKYFEGGREIMIIGVNCEDSCMNEEIRETAFTLNHEEVSHGINRLKGVEKTMNEEHRDYQNDSSSSSPETSEIESNKKYSKSNAKRQLGEIDKIMGRDKE
jgi:hypothetical protein